MKAWKKAEQRAARRFGSERTPLSGGNSKHTRSDSLHGELFIETKYGKRHAIWTLYDKTKTLAAKEDKTPLLQIFRKGSHGCLIVIHSSHFDKVRSVRVAKRKKKKLVL